ncbi:signal peptidase I [Paludibacter propionicigenes]|nr:signal peptidase I [Paludibacter propionicigenes]
MKIKYRLQKFWKIALQVLVLILVSVILTIVLKVFCFASFKVPSGSMEPTLKTGDYIMVNKMILGPRIFKDWKFWASGNWKMKRLKGMRAIRRNEILVFNFPITNDNWSKIEMDFNAHYVKRCVGIPGDTFYIEDGFYKVKGCNDTLGAYGNQQALFARNDSTLNKIVFNCFPFDDLHHWTMKNFGPLYIPKAKDKIQIDSKNIELYRKMIVYETGKNVDVNHDIVTLGGKPLTAYVFKMNYYFMAGDYVMDSKDSRYWGLLPEDHIIGKVSFIWKSEDENTGKYRWERFFKGV